MNANSATVEEIESVKEEVVMKRGRGRPRNPNKIYKPKCNIEVKDGESLRKYIMAKCNLSEIPSMESLFKGVKTHKVPVNNIAVFIAPHKSGLFKNCAIDENNLNIINYASEVDPHNVKKLAIDIFSKREIFMAIGIAKIDGKYQCWTGRHRLAVLELVYGPDVEVPVQVREMNLMEAREACSVANQAREITPREKAAHRVVSATEGDIDVEREQKYVKVVRNKGSVGDYAVDSVLGFSKLHGATLRFDVAECRTKSDKTMTTVANLRNFWKAALYWEAGMNSADFDKQLKASCSFLNDFVASLQEYQDFDKSQHLSGKTLTAVGKWCSDNEDFESAAKVALKLIELDGGIGSQPSEKTLKMLTKAMKE